MKLTYFFAIIVFVASAISLRAQTNAPINTVPEGITTFNIPQTVAGQSSTSYFSAPLCNDPVYTGAVESISTVTAGAPDTIMVGDQPPPWSTVNYGSTSTTPYFVKFLSGGQKGRVLQVLSNTASTLTLDTSDSTQTQVTPLNATGFAVAPSDTFEVFPGDTLALMFGSTAGTLVLNGGNIAVADTVTVFNRSSKHLQTYYFDTTAGFWKQSGGVANANNTIIYPYASFLIARRPSHAASSFVLTGRVAEVSHLVQTGGVTAVYDSSGYPVDIKLSQLNLTNWTEAVIPAPPAQPNIANADCIAIWDTTNNRYDTYFQCSDNTWRRQGGGTNDVSSATIPAGTTVSFLKRGTVSGAASFLVPVIPYTLSN